MHEAYFTGEKVLFNKQSSVPRLTEMVKKKMKVLVTQSVLSDSVTPWAVIHQVTLSMKPSQQEYWSELPFPPPGDLPDPGIEPWSPALQADSLPSKPPGKPLKFGTFLHNTKSFSVLSCPVFSSIVTLEVFHVLLYLK